MIASNLIAAAYVRVGQCVASSTLEPMVVKAVVVNTKESKVMMAVVNCHVEINDEDTVTVTEADEMSMYEIHTETVLFVITPKRTPKDEQAAVDAVFAGTNEG